MCLRRPFGGAPWGWGLTLPHPLLRFMSEQLKRHSSENRIFSTGAVSRSLAAFTRLFICRAVRSAVFGRETYSCTAGGLHPLVQQRHLVPRALHDVVSVAVTLAHQSRYRSSSRGDLPLLLRCRRGAPFRFLGFSPQSSHSSVLLAHSSIAVARSPVSSAQHRLRTPRTNKSSITAV
jgi:hypothetical protein